MNKEDIIKFLENLVIIKDDLNKKGFDDMKKLSSNFADIDALERTINIIKKLNE